MQYFKFSFVILAFIFLIGIEVLKVYYIMPFPGSQVDETINFAYFLQSRIFYFRILGFLLLIFALFSFWRVASMNAKIIIGIVFSFYLFVFILFNYYFLADHIFYQPSTRRFVMASESKVDSKQLVLGVFINGEAKAYPLEIIGYHHQVRDSIGGEPVMITYCTVCRTGRIYSPVVDGKPDEFRLVGMDHFNAMFEDKRTKSWWRQVNGEAITGPCAGKHLREIPSEQMTLRAWLQQHLNSKIMQPDTLYAQGYKDLALFDEGNIPSDLERRDSLSWKDKSWIIGVHLNSQDRAYDWNELIKRGVINDTLAGQPIVIALENDSVSFHTWKRDALIFMREGAADKFTDENTQSSWNWQGVCVEGPLKDNKLLPIQSYQEFWHSWKTFRPHTTRFKDGLTFK